MPETIVTRDEFERLFSRRWRTLRMVRTFGIREMLSGTWESSWVALWIGAPPLCKLGRHDVTLHEDWNDDGHFVECAWRECDRCGTFTGYVDA